MKKFIKVSLIVISFLCIFISCIKNTITSESTTEIFKQIILDDVYKEAYLNCIFYIENSSNSNRDIDTSIISVELLNENQKELVHIMNIEEESYFKDGDSKSWLFTIGDTTDHNFILLVCDSESNKVIGSIPTK
ncbi:MAG: hypothetical protein RSD26_11510 [Cellulosilyticaceae bacterium]